MNNTNSKNNRFPEFQNMRVADADLLPRDVETERALLGVILMDSECFPRIQGCVDSDDFSLESHRRIWRAMEVQHEAGGIIDTVSIASRLHDAQQLDLVGGLSYLTDKLDGTLANIMGVDTYCVRLREVTIRRKAILLLSAKIQELQIYGDSSAEVLESAQQTIHTLSLEQPGKLSTLQTPEAIIANYGGINAFLKPSTDTVVPTPWEPLNHMFGGGLRPGQLAIVAARPSIGKTAVALQFCQAAGRHDIGSGLFCLEMADDELLKRLACGAAGVDSNLARQGMLNQDGQRRLYHAMSEIARLPIRIDDSSGLTLARLHDTLMRGMKEAPIGLVVVDYLQLMQGAGRHENRNQEVSYLSRGLKLMAKELKLPFLVLSQLKRLEGEDKEPGLSDLRESGAIEQDADIVIFLHSKSDQKMLPVRRTSLIVAKQRNGPIGVLPMNFIRETARMEMATYDDQND